MRGDVSLVYRGWWFGGVRRVGEGSFYTEFESSSEAFVVRLLVTLTILSASAATSFLTGESSLVERRL